MIKKFFIILLLLVLSAIAYMYWGYSAKETLIIPYPFSFTPTAQLGLTQEINQAQAAKILIVGDRMGESLSQYVPELSEELAKSFKRAPIIYNWSKTHEGLHRTLYKLKSLKKLPSIIIYHGASSELFEKTFAISDKNAILKNFSLYDDERIISLIITFPWLSKIFYRKMQYIKLGVIKEYQNRLPSTDKILEKEVSFKLFEYEMRELINLAKDNKSNLILITTPINLEAKPHDICSHSTTNGVIEQQQLIEALLKEGNFKQAYPKALELSNETFSNAQSFYLLGKSAMGLGDLALARSAFQKAVIFDCATWRGNAVYNAIMKNEAKNHQIPLIDFDLYMSSALSKDGLFIDEIFPQNLFYQTMIEELKETLKKILSVD
ncbi:MAG: tetratricopeptide repeat protein [Bacteriovorax sp.]|nr:tetratricopeptide repeat protein [Bacteriovorax sp.]